MFEDAVFVAGNSSCCSDSIQRAQSLIEIQVAAGWSNGGKGILRSLTVSVSPRKVRPKLSVAGASNLLCGCLFLFLLISLSPSFQCNKLASS